MGNTTPMGISLAPPVFCANTASPRPSPITSPIIRMTTSVAARPLMAALLLVFVAPPFMAALFFAMNLHMATHLPCILVPAQPWPHPLAIARFCQQCICKPPRTRFPAYPHSRINVTSCQNNHSAHVMPCRAESAAVDEAEQTLP